VRGLNSLEHLPRDLKTGHTLADGWWWVREGGGPVGREGGGPVGREGGRGREREPVNLTRAHINTHVRLYRELVPRLQPSIDSPLIHR